VCQIFLATLYIHIISTLKNRVRATTLSQITREVARIKQ